MCGIVGYHSKNTTKEDLAVLKKVLLESRIRGKHASGIAWFDGKTIKSYVRPIPIDRLVEEFDLGQIVNNNDEVLMIAHSRYSTSDIRFNQPIVGKHIAIAHNGVITQQPHVTWESTFGYKCKTHNDSELLLKAIENNDNLFDKFPNSSIACIAITDKGDLVYFRNSIRPLWFGRIGEGFVYASTYDILNRAGVTGITKVNPSDCVEMQNRSMRHEY